MRARLASLVVLAAAAACVTATLALGRWQLHRASEKLARQEALVAQERLPELGNRSLPCEAQAWAAAQHRRVRLSGRWLTQETVILDNRAMNGHAGFYVLTPLQLEPHQTCASRVVWVQRGWLPRNRQDRTRLPPFGTPAGLVTVVARLMDQPSRAFSLGPDAPVSGAQGPRIVQNMDPAAWGAWWGHPVRPGVVLQLQPEQVDAGGGAIAEAPQMALLRDWPAPASDVAKHHAYAAQWFAMAALITGLYVWFQLIRPFRHRPR